MLFKDHEVRVIVMFASSGEATMEPSTRLPSSEYNSTNLVRAQSSQIMQIGQTFDRPGTKTTTSTYSIVQLPHLLHYFCIDRHLSGRGTARAEDAQGTPTQSHTSPSILVYEDNLGGGGEDGALDAARLLGIELHERRRVRDLCIVKSFRSRRFFISSPLWTP